MSWSHQYFASCVHANRISYELLVGISPNLEVLCGAVGDKDELKVTTRPSLVKNLFWRHFITIEC